MCAIKEKWESSSSNYQHTKSNILWEDWELSFCKLSVLIWAEDATRVCLVFRVALCGEKFSKSLLLNYWRMTHESTVNLRADTIFLSPIRKVDKWYDSNTIYPCTMQLPIHKWWLNLRISWNEKDIQSCNLCFIFLEEINTMEEKLAIDITSWPFP